MKKILSSPLFYPLILVLICLFIAFKNYTPGTFLTGWDTLHPEFNFPVNFQRLIFGVWRSDQGLGDLSGHSAMADLPRVFILWIFHFILPLNFLRYSYIFLCLIIGPLGFYFLIKYLFKNRLTAFLASLAYLFNLGTLQQFYVPFEMFPTQWAFLPWIILYSLKYLHFPKTKYLLIYSLITILATPQAYAAQLWYAFFVVYTLFLIIFRSRRGITLLAITLLINSFWLLPNVYYAVTSSQNPLTSKTNRLNSQMFLLQNRATGTLADTSLIKGFYFNWDEYNFSHKNSQNLTSVWNQHLDNIDVKIIGNLIFLLSFSGLIIAFLTKNKVLICLSPTFIIPFFLLANSTPIIRIPFDLLLKIPLFQELFRFVFTKVSILFTFAVCLYLANTIHLLLATFHIKKQFSLVFFISLLIYCYPYFSGQLISPIVRKNIPTSYFELYQYLGQKEPGRILSLPLNEPSGWQYYTWQYQGSGFLWFGFPQSLLDRDSDRWEVKNEQAYNEFYYPLYANNQLQFINSLLKYNVSYVLWDQSVIPTSPKNRDQITFKNETQKLLENNKLTFLKQFGSVYLYQVNSDTNLVKLQQINNYISPSSSNTFWDHQFSGNDYITTDIIHPPKNTTLIATYPRNETIRALNSTQGFQIELPELPHHQSYLIGFNTKFISGLPLRFCLYNSYSNLCTIEDQVNKNQDFKTDYFVVPPMDEFSGYTLNLNAISLASVPSVSQVKDISIYTLDNSIFASIPSLPNPQVPLNYQVVFPNNSLIKAFVAPSANNNYLTLYQSFNPGWLAFSNGHLLPHVLVNNWANGWSLDTTYHIPHTIYIVFWPQLLEFLGFGLLIGVFIWVIRK